MEDKLKVVLLGDSKTGKTRFVNLIQNYRNDIYSGEVYNPTLGVEFGLYKMSKIKIYIWEICGDKRFESIVNSYLNETRVFLLFCDINNISSIKNLNYWIDKIKENNQLNQKYFINIICSNFQNKKYHFNDTLFNQLHAKNYLDNISEQFKENNTKNGKIYFISKDTNLKKLFEEIYNSYLDFNKYFPTNNIKEENILIEKPKNNISRFCNCISSIFIKKKTSKTEPLLEN